METVTSEFEAPHANGALVHVAPPLSSGPRLMRREVWVDVDDQNYPGFRARLWVNYPRRLIDDIRQAADTDRAKAALNQMVTAHNDWQDYDGSPFPPASDPAFWERIPDELAGALIVLVNREAGKLASDLTTRPRGR